MSVSSPGARAPTDVLVVDDDASTVVLIKRIVERMGHRCVTVRSGEEAIVQLASARFGLIVTDINMPGMSGLEVLRMARERDPDVAVMVVSGVDDPGTADDALGSGAFGYVVKPFGVTELQIAVSNALRRRELEIELRAHLRGLEAEVDRRTEQLRVTTREAQRQEQRFRSLAQASPLGIVYTDLHGQLDYCNSSAEVLLGRSRQQLGGRRWLDDLDSSGRDALDASIETTAVGATGAPYEYELRRPDGSVVWLRSRVAPVLNDEQLVEGLVVLFEDIGDRQRLEHELRHQASHDWLTGLLNRREFRTRLSDRLSALEDGELLAVLMVDLDQFKLVNDTYGHEAGDQLIVEVGRRLTECMPLGSVVARLGGDEYIVALSGLDRAEVLAVGEDVREALRRPVCVSGIELSLSSSVGICLTSEPMSLASTLLRSADTALHHAKIRRDAIEVFDSSMAEDVARRLTLTSDLRRAVEQQELAAHFQPVFDTATQRLAGFEALARWTHQEWGRIGPDEFIPLATSIGLVHEIDRQVLSAAVTQLASWQAAGTVQSDVFVSVNLSASQLSNNGLPDLVQQILEESGVDGSSLVIEVTETSIIQDIERATPIVRRLRELGIRIAIDDFGTGHSALGYLGHLPLDILKIDRSFVGEIGAGGADMAEVIVDLAHRFDLEVIAEGIEQPRQLNRLRSVGCEMVQGYLLGRPAEAERAIPDHSSDDVARMYDDAATRRPRDRNEISA